MVMMRGVAVPVMAISLALLGCSTMRPATPPPTGLMWAYRAEAEALPSLHMIFYATDRATCELNRAKDVHQPPKDIAWVGLKITSECRQIAVGSGGDFWVFAASPQEATGAPDRDWCLKMRDGLEKTRGRVFGNCQPVAIKNVQ